MVNEEDEKTFRKLLVGPICPAGHTNAFTIFPGKFCGECGVKLIDPPECRCGKVLSHQNFCPDCGTANPLHASEGVQP
jgi:hypothetical protein